MSTKAFVPRDPARIPQLLALIEVLWRANPQQRLGQLVTNVASAAGAADVYNTEDTVLIAHIRKQFGLDDPSSPLAFLFSDERSEDKAPQ